MAGGSERETVTCLHYDNEVTNFTVVAGYSDSKDFASNSTGLTNYAFAYAIDYRGNWRWGKYFTN